MNSRLPQMTYAAVIAGVFAFPALAQAQITEYQQDQWLHTAAITSHVGNVTGDGSGAEERYRRYCQVCHGKMGDGNGESAQWFEPPLYPKPRDFTLGVFKCRSTPTGTLAHRRRSLQHDRARDGSLEHAALEYVLRADASGPSGVD